MSKRHQEPKPEQDTEIILLCAKLVALEREQRVIEAADHWAPDKGPLHPRFEAIDAKEREIVRKLFALGRPHTQGGIAALAEAALLRWARTLKGLECEDTAEWLALAVIQGVSETDESVDPRDCLRRTLGLEAVA